MSSSYSCVRGDRRSERDKQEVGNKGVKPLRKSAKEGDM